MVALDERQVTVGTAETPAPSFRQRLNGGLTLEAAAAAEAGDGEHVDRVLVRPLRDERGAVLALAEGIPADLVAAFYRHFESALDRDHGTPAWRLQRAVRLACRELERGTLHRHELTGLGVTAVLVDTSRTPYAYFCQLPPCQAYVLDDEGLHAFPAEQLQRAGQVASANGRAWEVEIEVARTALRPGSSLLVGDSSLLAGTAPGRVEEMLQLAPPRAAAELLAEGARGHRPLTLSSPAAIALRIGRASASTGVRLFSVGEGGRRPLRVAPSAADARDPTHAVAGRYRIEPWGLERDRQRRGPLRQVIGRFAGPTMSVSAAPSRLPRLLIAGLLLAAAGVLVRPLVQRLPLATMLHRTAPTTAVETTPAPAPTPALPGRTLAAATAPFRAFAVAGGGTVGGTSRFFVLDQGQRLASFAADGAPLDTWNLESSEPGLLVGRDEGLLWLDGERVLRSIGGAAEAPAIVPLRGSRQWQRPVAAATYAGNLYVLDAGSGDGPGQIWRHAGTPGGFDSDPQPWLQASSGANVSGARGFAIDGSIWVARGEAGIVRLTAGRPDSLQLAGIDPPLASAGAVYTEFGYRSIYVADATTRRVLQFSKDGRFEQQVTDVFPVGEAPLGLWVDEPSGRCVILTTGRLQDVQLPR